MKVILFLFLATASFGLLAKTVVVTIPPLASAIKPLLNKSDKVVVLLSENQSAHHFSLKPSHLYSLAKADLIISVGLGLDDWAGKAIERSGVKHISLSEVDGVKLLDANAKKQGHEHHHEHHKNVDPHLWLDIDNIKQLAVKVSSEIKTKHKLVSWLEQLDTANKDINNRLQKIKNKPFLVQHAGFQYFEKKYNLTNLGAVQTNDAGAGLKKILALRKKMEKESIRCIFTSPHGSTKQVAALVSGLKQSVKIVTLNAMGAPNLNTVQVMQDLTQRYLQCLSD